MPRETRMAAPVSFIRWILLMPPPVTGRRLSPINKEIAACAGLNVEESREPFPHVNTTDDFRALLGLQPAD